MPKLVVSSSPELPCEWNNSTLLKGDLVDEVAERKQAQDLVVAGSASVARMLMEHNLIDEYRLLVFPLVIGEGRRLFPEGAGPVSLALVSAETAGPAVRLVYTGCSEPVSSSAKSTRSVDGPS